MKRGFSLIEMMIVVAIVGITAAGSGYASALHRKHGLAALQRARAEVLLQYLADCRLAKRAPDPAVQARLEEGLPQVTARVRPGERVDSVEVRFQPAVGAEATLQLWVMAQ